MLVVAPRLELRQAEIKAQAPQLQRTEDKLVTLQGQVAGQRKVDGGKVPAVDAASAVRTEPIERTTVIREAAQARAEASGGSGQRWA